MTLLNKRYCSHCGTPNTPTNETCSKCGKPLSSGLTQHIPQGKPVKASRFQRAPVNESDDDWDGEIIMPSSNDVLVETPRKLTIGGLKNGAGVPSFGGLEQLPADIQVTSKSYFHDQKFD